MFSIHTSGHQHAVCKLLVPSRFKNEPELSAPDASSIGYMSTWRNGEHRSRSTFRHAGRLCHVAADEYRRTGTASDPDTHVGRSLGLVQPGNHRLQRPNLSGYSKHNTRVTPEHTRNGTTNTDIPADALRLVWLGWTARHGGSARRWRLAAVLVSAVLFAYRGRCADGCKSHVCAFAQAPRVETRTVVALLANASWWNAASAVRRWLGWL